jgi:protein O-GlcNAc transferase
MKTDRFVGNKPLADDQTFQRGLAALRAGKLRHAEQFFKAAIRTQPGHVAALNLLGIVLTQLDRNAEAETYLRRALDEHPDTDVTLYNYGLVLKQLNRPAEALDRFTQALAIKSTVAETWNNRGTVLNDLRRYDEAVADFDRAIAIDQNYCNAFVNKGNALLKLKLSDLSLVAYDRALTLKSDLAEAWLGRGNALIELAQYDKALAAYDRALAVKSNLAEAWLGRGTVFAKLRRYGDAIAAYGKAAALEPDLDYVASLRLDAKLRICEWTNLEAEMTQLLATIRERKLLSDPFIVLAPPSSAADQLDCAKHHIKDQPVFAPIWRAEVYSHRRIRVAYLSADFREHPVASLVVGMFERHDRSRFEVTGLSFGGDEDSPLRRRIKDAFEHFIDVRHDSDKHIADLGV